MFTSTRRRFTRRPSPVAAALIEACEPRIFMSGTPLFMSLNKGMHNVTAKTTAPAVVVTKLAPAATLVAAPKATVLKATASKAVTPPAPVIVVTNPKVQVGTDNKGNLSVKVNKVLTTDSSAVLTLLLTHVSDNKGDRAMLAISAPGFKTLNIAVGKYNGVVVTDNTGGTINIVATDTALMDDYVPYIQASSQKGTINVTSVVAINATANTINQMDTLSFNPRHYLVGNNVTSETGGVTMSSLSGNNGHFYSSGFLDSTVYAGSNAVVSLAGGDNIVYGNGGCGIKTGDGNDQVTLYGYSQYGCGSSIDVGGGWDNINIYGSTNSQVAVNLAGSGTVNQYSQLLTLTFVGGTDGSGSYLIKDNTLVNLPDILPDNIINCSGTWYQDLYAQNSGGKG